MEEMLILVDLVLERPLRALQEHRVHAMRFNVVSVREANHADLCTILVVAIRHKVLQLLVVLATRSKGVSVIEVIPVGLPIP